MMANSDWADRVTRGLERQSTFAGGLIGGGGRPQELQGGLSVSHQARAMARGGAAYWAGLPCVPPENESILTVKAWVRGWEHASEDVCCPGCPDCGGVSDAP